MHVDTQDALEGLITLPDSLFLYNVWIVPRALLDTVQSRLEHAENCLGNIVVAKERSEAHEVMVSKLTATILKVGSPVEYI